MTEWKAKRFWTDVHVEAADNGYGLRLDQRVVSTPNKARLIVPTEALAELIAQEWRAQGEIIDPNTMPHTRMANSAIDKVTPQFAAVVDVVAAYAGSDLLCYRATEPAELVARQAKIWDSLLSWVTSAYDVVLKVTSGIMPVEQESQELEILRAEVAALNPFALTAFHDLVSLSGSLVIALALRDHHLGVREAWDASVIDDLWQEELWGVDHEAQELREHKSRGFLQAFTFMTALERP